MSETGPPASITTRWALPGYLEAQSSHSITSSARPSSVAGCRVNQNPHLRSYPMSTTP